jgi:tRNA dimethylallyltransferase
VSVVIAVFGPTGSGKSSVAEAIVARMSAEVVSSDAMQAYRGLPILTNQPTSPCRLVGIWPLDHEGSVGEYAALAHAAIDEILAAGNTPIVAGGTGLYLRAALAELAVPPAPARGAREQFERLYDEVGPTRAHELLTEKDPAAAEAVHPNDRRRVVRAHELAEAGFSLRPVESRLWTGALRHPTAIFGLELPGAVLEARVRARTEAMFERGVREEVDRALASPISRAARAAIGVDEVASLARAAAIEAIVSKTLQYAAYQRKWLRRIEGAVSVSANRPPGEIADEILEMARAR